MARHITENTVSGLLINTYSEMVTNNDWSPVFEKILTEKKTQSIKFKGMIGISRPITLSVGNYLEGDGYTSYLYPLDNFVGDALVKYTIQGTSYTIDECIGMNKVKLNCLGKPVHGVIIEDAFDQTVWNNVKIVNVHNDYQALILRKQKFSVCQSATFNDWYMERKFDSTKPLVICDTVQETTFNQCKFFPNPANSTNKNGSIGIDLIDSKGINLNACSFAFGETAIRIQSPIRSVQGVFVNGASVEEMDNLLKCVKTNEIKDVRISKFRMQNCSPIVDLTDVNNAIVESDSKVILERGYGSFVTTARHDLIDFRSGNHTVLVGANGVNTFAEYLTDIIFKNLTSKGKIMLDKSRADKAELVWNATTTVDYGVQVRTNNTARFVFGNQGNNESYQNIIPKAAVNLGNNTDKWKQLFLSESLNLTGMTASNAPNNSVFIDTSDSKLKFKDSTGVIKIVTLT